MRDGGPCGERVVSLHIWEDRESVRGILDEFGGVYGLAWGPRLWKYLVPYTILYKTW